MALTDEQQITELQALWSQHEIDRRPDEWAALWTEDGRYIRPDGSVTAGREAIRQSLLDRIATRAPERQTIHIFGPTLVRIDGDTAESSAEHVAFLKNDQASPWGIILVGRMNNKLVKQNGKWLFTEVSNRGYFMGNPPPDRLPDVHRD
jgi:uncharacterized protein (TIGR02246 family)